VSRSKESGFGDYCSNLNIFFVYGECSGAGNYSCSYIIARMSSGSVCGVSGNVNIIEWREEQKLEELLCTVKHGACLIMDKIN